MILVMNFYLNYIIIIIVIKLDFNLYSIFFAKDILFLS